MHQIEIPSAPVLFYLFADLVVAPARRLGGTETPCRGTSVKMAVLAETIAASAFWSLRERGEADVDLIEHKRLLGSGAEVVVAIRRPGMRDLPGSLADAAEGLGAPSTVEVILHAWLGRDSTLPAMQIIGLAALDAMRLGLVDEVPARRGALGALLLGATAMRPDCAAIAALEPAAKEAVAGWQVFRTAETPLADALVRSCRAGIESRAKPTNVV